MDGYNGNTVWASAYFRDRIWIQAQGYGPAAGWDDGFPLRNLVNCA